MHKAKNAVQKANQLWNDCPYHSNQAKAEWCEAIIKEVQNALCTIYADDIVSRQYYWKGVKEQIEQLINQPS